MEKKKLERDIVAVAKEVQDWVDEHFDRDGKIKEKYKGLDEIIDKVLDFRSLPPPSSRNDKSEE